MAAASSREGPPYSSNPAGRRLGIGILGFVILDKAKLRNNRPDYDAIGIRWNGNVYRLAAQDDLIYPLMKFIKRGSYIAYTIPVAGFDEAYFLESALVPGGNGYVAQEFESASHAEFLDDVDFAMTEKMPANLKAMIMKDVKDVLNQGNVQLDEYGSYVNADFHVKYQVFLKIANGKRVADVGGLPLRYHWSIGEDGSAIIEDVEVFKFPEEEFGLQDRAVMFFQTAAILRQFSENNRREFDRFLREVGAVVGER